VAKALAITGYFAIWFGGSAILGIAIWLAMDGHDRLVRHRFARLSRRTCAALAAARRAAGRVAVSGVTAPGPAGMLTAPLSGKPCVWYRVNVGHTSESADSRDDVTSWSRTAGHPTAVDDGTGRVLLSRWLLDRALDGDSPGLVKRSLATRDPIEVAQHLAVLQARGLLPARKLDELARYDELWVAEAVVRAGREVVAVGLPWGNRHGKMLVPHPLGTYGVSRDDLGRLRERTADLVGPDKWWEVPLLVLCAGGLLIGCGVGALFLGGVL
jgi:hypothetical protein